MQKWEEEAIIRAEGKEEGREENMINSITQLMKNLKWTSDQAMEALGIPKSDFKKYADKL